ncbi:hypothetical protein GCM10020358_42680 [Amorphoplanes nipponensis]|uniref:Serine protease inhibitor n=1 Tax=Actinoplanes nipponensis TaxID=135950 RepID=A0A919MKB1_9ACTN|nr:hypothetical protein [Actinoplanes nipponensis]GIE47542.1 hypothetical protein Ani05nite_10760 [Actinoplanes nipponensis]
MTTPLYDALAAYAERLHAGIGDGHHVASPLGAWLLLALCASAGGGPAGDELAEVLGMPAGDAASAAAALLEHPHPLVSSATAVWHAPDRDTDGLRDWQAGLPPSTTVGLLPAQEAADAWAREHTGGLIGSFPLAVTPEVAVLLASALATRVSWAQPFEVAAAAALGPDSAWAAGLTRMLRSPEEGHVSFIAATDRAGDVVVHIAEADCADRDLYARTKVLVISVAAAPGVEAGDVLAAAYAIGRGAADDVELGRRSLYDLPLGDSGLWSIREEAVLTDLSHEERYTAVLPCWSAESDHDLTGPGLGFTTAARILAEALPVSGRACDARQVAMARYGRYGFEAAAVSGFAVLESMPSEGVARIAELRFGHPYAVLAVTVDIRDGDRGRELGPWHGVPVFSAWVSRPEDLPAADA